MNQPILKLVFSGTDTTAGDKTHLSLAVLYNTVARAPTAGIYSENDQDERAIRLQPLVFRVHFRAGRNWNKPFAHHPGLQGLRASE